MTALILEHPLKGTVLLGAFLAGLLTLYIFQVNALTAQVYHMGDQEKHLGQLKEQNLHLVPSFTRTQMEELAQLLQFERVQKVSYLRVLGSAVAEATSQE